MSARRRELQTICDRLEALTKLDGIELADPASDEPARWNDQCDLLGHRIERVRDKLGLIAGDAGACRISTNG